MQKFKLPACGFLTALFVFAALCSAQTISIVSGNGQVVCPDCPGAPGVFAPLVVLVKDASGNPVVGTTVSWTVSEPQYSFATGTSVTNSSGEASYAFPTIGFFYGGNFLPATVVASVPNYPSATFVENTVQPVDGAAPLTVSLVPYGSAPALSGAVGSTGKVAIVVSVLGNGGITAISNVSVTLQTPVPGKTPIPTVACATTPGQQPGTVLTNSDGIATCSPVFGGALGTGTYSIVVGGNLVTFPAGKLTVTPGAPAMLSFPASGSGNNSTLNVNSSIQLTALVTDASGVNPASGAVVTWAVTSTSGTAKLSTASTTSGSSGLVATVVTPTAGPGPIKVTATLVGVTPAVTLVFTVNVNIVVTALQNISSLTEATNVNTAFPDALTVQVNDNGQAVPGVTVSFAATSGVSINQTSVTTGPNGQAQVTATAGDTPGTYTVTASITSAGKTYSQTFTLTVNPNGATITSVNNAAGFQNQFVSPCSLATIFGTGLADNIQGVVASFIEPLPTVANVSVTFNGVTAPILDVANENGQESVSVQVPCELSTLTLPATVSMVVTVNNYASPAFNVSVAEYSPGIFQAFDPYDGVLRAVLVRPDGSFVSAVNNPARRGEVIRMWVTGLGPTSPALFTNEFDPLVPDANGNLVPQMLAVQASLVVGVNNSGVSVISANYAYGMVGVYEVDFEVPASTTPGSNVPFAIAVVEGNNLLFGNASLIAIE